MKHEACIARELDFARAKAHVFDARGLTFVIIAYVARSVEDGAWMELIHVRSYPVDAWAAWNDEQRLWCLRDAMLSAFMHELEEWSRPDDAVSHAWPADDPNYRMLQDIYAGVFVPPGWPDPTAQQHARGIKLAAHLGLLKEAA